MCIGVVFIKFLGTECLSFSIPDENFEDHSAPPSPEEKDSGFFLLKKDSERRATLHRILTEDQEEVVRNLMEALAQVKQYRKTAKMLRNLKTYLQLPGAFGNTHSKAIKNQFD